MKVLVLALLFVVSSNADNSAIPYKEDFIRVAKRYWSDTPHNWLLLAETARAESSFRPKIKSYVGALGLMQIMPGTWKDIKKQGVKIGSDATNPRDNILAGGYYLRRMYRISSQKYIEEEDMVKDALASYNAGPGNLQKARRLAGGPEAEITFEEVGRELEKVTGKHAAGTVKYSNKIWNNYAEAKKDEKSSQGTVRDVPEPEPRKPIVQTVEQPREVHVVIEQKKSWPELLGILYLLFSGRKNRDEQLKKLLT